MYELTVKALVFDMDGTLVDSGIAVKTAWQSFSKRYGIDYQEVFEYANGRTTLAAITHFLKDPQLAKIEVEKVEVQESCALSGGGAVPGVLHLLQSLPADKWAVATSATRAVTEFRLRTAGLPLPKYIVCAEDVEFFKPHPQCFLQALELLQVSPSEALIFEDSYLGVTGALASGATTVVVGEMNAYDEQAYRIANYLEVQTKLDLDTGEISLQFL